MSVGSRLARSILTLGAGQALSWLGAALLLVLLPRYLGDANLGKLSFAFALTALFGLLADLGGTTYLAKEVARAPALAGSLTWNVLVTRLPLGALAAALAAGFVWVAGYDSLTQHTVYVLCVGITIGSLANTFGATLQGLERMRALAASMVAGKLLQSALMAALLLNGAGPVEVAVISVLATGVGAVIGGGALRREIATRARITSGEVFRVLGGGLPFFVWQAALVVYGQIDVVMLSIMTRDAVVGWYAAAYRIIMLPSFVPTIVITAAFPALSATSRSPIEFARLARRSIELIALTTVPMAFGILVIPDKIVQFLGYPASFANSVAPIMFLSLHLPLAGIDMVIGTVLGTLDRQRVWALTGVAAAFLNPAANLVAIPVADRLYGNGAIGAALVTSLTELFMLAIGLRLLPAEIFTTSTLRYVLRCVGAGIFMAAVVAAARGAPLLLVVGLGAITYALASLGLRTLSLSEIRWVVGGLLRRALPTAPLSAEGIR